MRVAVDPAIAELQRLRPAKLRVYVRDADEPKAVAIPGNRKRWERLGALLEGLDWTRIEALDPRGNITGVVARDEPEVSAPTEEVDADESVAPLLALMLRAQQMALQQQSVMLKPLIDGQAKLVGVMTEALGAVAGAYRMALAAASTAGVASKGGGEADDDGLGKFLQFAMMMAMRGGQGPAAALGAVKAASDVAASRPRSASKPTPAPQGASGGGPGPGG